MAETTSGGAPRIGFVFDLDGVVYHSGAQGKALVPGTADALALLEHHGVPYAFVSNGTGYSEHEKAALIEGLLRDAAVAGGGDSAAAPAPAIKVPREKVFLCATPMRDLAKEYAGRRVMIVAGDTGGGPDTAARLADDLGFVNYVTLADFAARRPHLTPHLKNPPPPVELLAGKSVEPIAACFVLHEPGDWLTSLQVLCDVAACCGEVALLEPDADQAARAVAAAASLAEGGEEADSRASFRIYLTNPDIVYPVRNAPPRFTLGSFGLCLGSMYQRLASLRPGLCGPMDLHYCGKPFPMVFESAQRYLETRAALAAGGAAADERPERVALHAIYMVGDNPPSDIRGANDKGAPWQSCLVRTGNFHGVDNDEQYPARHVLKDAWTVVTTMLAAHGIIDAVPPPVSVDES